MSRLRYLSIPFAAAALLLAIAVTGTRAQPAPGRVEHFKTYKIAQPVPMPRVVHVIDQFGAGPVEIVALDQFANPVNKNGEGLLDPFTHLSWWLINDLQPPPPHHVLVSNQFAHQVPWDVGPARWLLTPATKDSPGAPVPTGINHFKCYQAVGPPLQIPVNLQDQWGGRQALVTVPECLCNPAEKITEDGTVYPIVDPTIHLACYRLDPPMTYGIFFTWMDQFFMGENVALEDCLLCVPSLKEEPTPAEPSTWGRVKAQYR